MSKGSHLEFINFVEVDVILVKDVDYLTVSNKKIYLGAKWLKRVTPIFDSIKRDFNGEVYTLLDIVQAFIEHFEVQKKGFQLGENKILLSYNANVNFIGYSRPSGSTIVEFSVRRDGFKKLDALLQRMSTQSKIKTEDGKKMLKDLRLLFGFIRSHYPDDWLD